MPRKPDRIRTAARPVCGIAGCWKGALAALALVAITACGSTGPASAAAEDDAGTVFGGDGNIAGKFLAGRHAEVIGDYTAAVDLTRDVLEAIPDDRKLLARTHLLLISVGKVDDALVLAERLVENDENDPLGNLTLALRALHGANWDTALGRLDRLEISGANRVLVPLLRAWTLAGSGDTPAALAALDAFRSSDSYTVIADLHGGLIAEFGGDDTAAEAHFKRAAGDGDRPVPLQVVHAQGRFLARIGRAEEARALGEAFLQRHPGNLLVDPYLEALGSGALPASLASTPPEGGAQSLRTVADLLHREGVNGSALVFAQLALYLDSKSAATQSLLAGVLRAQGRHDEAIAMYKSIDPASPYAWYGRLDTANNLQAMDDVDGAIELLRGMVDERPERSDAARALGDFLRFEENYQAAASAYDKAIDRSADDPDWRLYYSRGITLERLKDWPRAEKDFLRALELQPDHPLVLNYLGYSWVEQGTHLDEARAMIEKAVAQRPRDGYITDSLGWVLYRLGDYENAVTWLEKAVSLAPGDPTINDHLGDAYWLVDRRKEAEFQWHRALSLDPEPDLIDSIRAKIDGSKRPQPLPPGERRDI